MRAVAIGFLMLAMIVFGCRDEKISPKDGGPTLRATIQRTFTGGSGYGRRLAFSPDGRLLATTNTDGTVALWLVPDAVQVWRVHHSNGATSVAFNPDGRWLASGGYDGKVRIWRVSDGRLLRTLEGHKGTVWAVAVRGDGQVIASSGEDRTIRLWRTADGALLRTLTGHSLNVWTLDFSGDGEFLVSGSFDESVRVWRVATGQLMKTLDDHEEAVVSLAVSPDGSRLVTAGDDATIRLWRLPEATLTNTIDAENHVYSVAWSADGKWIASGGREKGAIGTFWKGIVGKHRKSANDTSIRLWRASDGVFQQGLAGHSDDVWGVAFSSDGKWLGSSSESGSVALWRLEELAAK